MKIFKCGCDLNGTRCDTHRDWGCHDVQPQFFRRETLNGKTTLHPIEADPIVRDGVVIGYVTKSAGECPPCFVERLRSIQLGAGTTPTRGNR
ncbi:MAG: hypothetical protein IT345_15130 [Trueperaceae bacterium]|nr:hypothetical protein [Trueperaceae bacterium]